MKRLLLWTIVGVALIGRTAIAQTPVLPASMVLYEVVPEAFAPVLSRWASAVGISLAGADNPIKVRASYERWDTSGWSFLRYPRTGDLIISREQLKYKGIAGRSFNLTDSEAVQIALTFLKGHLLLDVSVGRDELKTTGVRHVVDEFFDTLTGVSSERVNTAIAIFGRNIDGFEAIGPGAHVAIYVGADRSVVGADVAWRSLRPIGTVRPEDPFAVLRASGISMGGDSKIEIGYYFGDRTSQELVLPVAWVTTSERTFRTTTLVPLVSAPELLRRSAFSRQGSITLRQTAPIGPQ